MEESELQKRAVEELLNEAGRARVRAETMGPSGWMKCPLRTTNKRFLLNTLRSTRGQQRHRPSSPAGGPGSTRGRQGEAKFSSENRGHSSTATGDPRANARQKDDHRSHRDRSHSRHGDKDDDRSHSRHGDKDDGYRGRSHSRHGDRDDGYRDRSDSRHGDNDGDCRDRSDSNHKDRDDCYREKSGSRHGDKDGGCRDRSRRSNNREAGSTDHNHTKHS